MRSLWRTKWFFFSFFFPPVHLYIISLHRNRLPHTHPTSRHGHSAFTRWCKFAMTFYVNEFICFTPTRLVRVTRLVRCCGFYFFFIPVGTTLIFASSSVVHRLTLLLYRYSVNFNFEVRGQLIIRSQTVSIKKIRFTRKVF